MQGMWVQKNCGWMEEKFVFIAFINLSLLLLAEERGSEASLTYKSFPWCCPKCFKKGKAALEKMLLAPSQPKRKR